MFTVTYTHSRPNTHTKFFYDASPEIKAMIDHIEALTRSSAGFVSLTSAMSDDKLSNVVSVVWKDQASWEGAEGVNKEFLDDYRAARMVYDAVLGLSTATVTEVAQDPPVQLPPEPVPVGPR